MMNGSENERAVWPTLACFRPLALCGLCLVLCGTGGASGAESVAGRPAKNIKTRPTGQPSPTKENQKLAAEKAAESLSARVRALLEAAHIAHEIGDFRAEQAAYEAILVWDGSNKKARKLLERLHENKNEWERQLEKKRKEQELEEKVNAHLREADDLRARGELDKALAKAEEALRIVPGHARARSVAQGLQSDIEKHKRASAAESATRVELVRQWLNQASALIATKKEKEAEALVGRAIALKGDSQPVSALLDQFYRKYPALAVLDPDEHEPVFRATSTPGTRPEGISEQEWKKANELLAKATWAERILSQEKEFQVNIICNEAEKEIGHLDFDGAQKLLQDAMKILPDHPRIRKLAKRLYEFSGKDSDIYQEFLKQLQKAR